MSNIEVEEYIRTKYGIAKVIDIEENPNKEKTIYVLDENIINVEEAEYSDFYIITHPFAETMINKFDTHFGDEKQILKHSKNITDLIEVGDIIEYDIDGFTHKADVFKSTYYNLAIATVNNGIIDLEERPEIIKSIMIKELFKEMEYRINE